MDHLAKARFVIDAEIDGLRCMSARLDGRFIEAVEILRQTLEKHDKESGVSPWILRLTRTALCVIAFPMARQPRFEYPGAVYHPPSPEATAGQA